MSMGTVKFGLKYEAMTLRVESLRLERGEIVVQASGPYPTSGLSAGAYEYAAYSSDGELVMRGKHRLDAYPAVDEPHTLVVTLRWHVDGKRATNYRESA